MPRVKTMYRLTISEIKTVTFQLYSMSLITRPPSCPLQIFDFSLIPFIIAVWPFNVPSLPYHRTSPAEIWHLPRICREASNPSSESPCDPVSKNDNTIILPAPNLSLVDYQIRGPAVYGLGDYRKRWSVKFILHSLYQGSVGPYSWLGNER